MADTYKILDRCEEGVTMSILVEFSIDLGGGATIVKQRVPLYGTYTVQYAKDSADNRGQDLQGSTQQQLDDLNTANADTVTAFDDRKTKKTSCETLDTNLASEVNVSRDIT